MSRTFLNVNNGAILDVKDEIADVFAYSEEWQECFEINEGVTVEVAPSVIVEPVVEDVVEDVVLYSKSDISNMRVAQLRELATSCGVDDAESKSGSELKKLLVKHFNL